VVRIGLGYDGGAFSGWAAQPGKRTVQAVVSAALGQVLRLSSPPALTVAGRTDAGVHARGQVAHTRLPADRWHADKHLLPRRLGAVLPPDVRVFQLQEAPEGFDARFSALWRRYSYRVCDDRVLADPLQRHRTVWHFRQLDLGAMNQAAGALLGEHDFAAFCKKRDFGTTIRALRRLDWVRDPEGTAVATVVADAFCHNMVRALMGALIAVGDGRRPPAWPLAILSAQIRDPAVKVMPPHGLCLEEVRYPPDAELAERAVTTRRPRA
jgi:tRNA pseudouridine38-40 synthase